MGGHANAAERPQQAFNTVRKDNRRCRKGHEARDKKEQDQTKRHLDAHDDAFLSETQELPVPEHFTRIGKKVDQEG
mgnify:CR=1 FL=1